MAITYKNLTDTFISLIKSHCLNIDLYSNSLYDAYGNFKTVTVNQGNISTEGSSIVSPFVTGQARPPIITSSDLRSLIQTEFARATINIDVTSTATRTFKEAIHFINAALVFICYHVFFYIHSDGTNIGYFFIKYKRDIIPTSGFPILTSTKGVSDSDLMLETYNAITSMLTSTATRIPTIDLTGSSINQSSCSSSSCSSSCSSSSSSCSCSSIFIAYFNI